MSARSKDELIAHYNRLSRSLANEFLPEQDAEAIRRELAGVRAEIDGLAESST